MKRSTLFGLTALVLLISAGTVATVAFAESSPLPLIHTALPGETYPLLLGASSTAEGIALVNEAATLVAASVSILLTVTELSTLGTATVIYTGAEYPLTKEKCSSAGNPPGLILEFHPEFHLAYTSLSPTAVLETAILTKFSTLPIFCGLLEITEIGPLAARISLVPGTLGDGTSLELADHCASKAPARQEISSYYDDSVEPVATTLLAVVGETEFRRVKACDDIPGTLLLKVATGSTATMFTILL